MIARALAAAALLVMAAAGTARAQTSPPLPPRASCAQLAALALPNTMMAAELVAAGAMTPPPSQPFSEPTPGRPFFAALPAFCRVSATLKPSSDSDIKTEVWLPVDGWNQKFQGVGNGGWNGGIAYRALGDALRGGYAAASTDTGHAGSGADASFALGHPEKLTDFAFRAVHEMTLTAKAIVRAYYGAEAHRSYWNGCSSGGKQGLKEAQRFPADYDGIVAIAPANNWARMLSAGIAISQTTTRAPLSRDAIALITKAVLDACDAHDGVKDGVLEDPLACRFDVATLACKAGADETCLTAPQLASAQAMYRDTVNPRTGERIFPGFAAGSEPGWTAFAGTPDPFPIADSYFKFVVFKDPAWNFQQFALDRDAANAERTDGGSISATDPNLKPYFGRGGKLLMLHGWSDELISPINSIDYYRQVVDTVGASTAAGSIQLFMVPGMRHCAGGPGPNLFDAVAALDEWVEQGRVPTRILASHAVRGVVDRTRPLCPYPQIAAYKGSGSTDDAANFVCAASK
jgi:feruloyl esterase